MLNADGSVTVSDDGLGIEFEFDRLSERFRELAFLHAGLKLSVIDRRSPSARNAIEATKAAEIARQNRESRKQSKD